MSDFNDKKIDEFMKRNMTVPKAPADEWLKIQSRISSETSSEGFWFKRKVFFATCAASFLFAFMTINLPIYDDNTPSEISQLIEMTESDSGDDLSSLIFEEEV